MQWYTVYTKPNHERQAELSLQRLGVETFYPQVKQRKVIRRREQTVIGSLFPRYFFARLNLETHYRAATYARGVRNLVAFGPSPAVVDEKLIEAIKSRVCDGYATVSAQSFMPGQVVRIQEGPLCGLEAIFERKMTDQQRAVLLLRTLAYQARVVVPLEQVVNA
ncbi:MAG: transcription termination/antitermination NusG family protein [Nitrospiraceae bacterium]